MTEKLGDSIGVRVTEPTKERLQKVADAKGAATHSRLKLSDIARECVEQHLPVLERKYGVNSPKAHPHLAKDAELVDKAAAQVLSSELAKDPPRKKGRR